MNIENEEMVDRDSVGPTILKNEIVEANNKMKVNKAEGVNGITVEFWKVFREKGMNEMTSLCHTECDKGEWPDEFS